MCGIFGIIKPTQSHPQRVSNMLEQSLYVGAVRGIHSTGIAAIPRESKDELIVYKKAVIGSDFIYMPTTRKILEKINNYKYLICHHRAATVGAVSSNNAHPFQKDHITLVHNGTLEGLYDLGVKDWFDKVDSEIIAELIAEQGFKKALPRLRGAYALMWHDKKEDAVYLYRNDQRPLHFATTKDPELTVIASEELMLHWLAWRNEIEVKKYHEVKPHVVLVFRDGKLTPSETHIIKPNPVQPKLYTFGSSGGSTGTNSYTKGGNYSSKKIEDLPPALAEERKRTVKEVMANMGISPNDEVKFTYARLDVKRHKSRHGTLSGHTTTDPYYAVKAFNVPTKDLKSYYSYIGQVQTVMWDIDRKEWTILLHNVRANTGNTKQDNAKEVDKSQDIPALEGEETRLEIKGPRGKLISNERFDVLTKRGCINCSCNLTSEMAEMITWVGVHGDDPLCPVCATEGQEHMDFLQ